MIPAENSLRLVRAMPLLTVGYSLHHTLFIRAQIASLRKRIRLKLNSALTWLLQPSTLGPSRVLNKPSTI